MISGAGRGLLVAVDPSIVSAGVAVFHDGELCAAACLREKADGRDVVSRAVSIARRVERFVGGDQIDAKLVVEWPQVYQRGRSKGDPNALTPLAAVAGACAALLPTAEPHAIRPRDWKGQIPKPKGKASYIVETRSRAALTAVETVVFDQARNRVGKVPTDVSDAVGLGLWALGRAFRRRRGVTR